MMPERTWRASIKKLAAAEEELQRIVKLEVVTNGCTNTLRLSEQVKKLSEKTGENSSLSDEKSSLMTKARKESVLESVDNAVVAVEQLSADKLKEFTFQIDIGVFHLSLIAKNEKGIRREFLLAECTAIEYLEVATQVSKEIQLKVGYF